MNYQSTKNYKPHFAYFTANYLRFDKDFNQYYILEAPLPTLTDDLLHSMHASKSNFFRLPAYKARDNRDHYFFFETSVDHREKTIIYRYTEHQVM